MKMPMYIVRFVMPTGSHIDHFFREKDTAAAIQDKFYENYNGEMACRSFKFEDDLGQLVVITNAYISCVVFHIEKAKEYNYKYALIHEELDSRFSQKIGFGHG